MLHRFRTARTTAWESSLRLRWLNEGPKRGRVEINRQRVETVVLGCPDFQRVESHLAAPWRDDHVAHPDARSVAVNQHLLPSRRFHGAQKPAIRFKVGPFSFGNFSAWRNKPDRVGERLLPPLFARNSLVVGAYEIASHVSLSSCIYFLFLYVYNVKHQLDFI